MRLWTSRCDIENRIKRKEQERRNKDRKAALGFFCLSLTLSLIKKKKKIKGENSKLCTSTHFGEDYINF